MEIETNLDQNEFCNFENPAELLIVLKMIKHRWPAFIIIIFYC